MQLNLGIANALGPTTGAGATLGARGVSGVDVGPHRVPFSCPATTRRAFSIARSASSKAVSSPSRLARRPREAAARQLNPSHHPPFLLPSPSRACAGKSTLSTWRRAIEVFEGERGSWILRK